MTLQSFSTTHPQMLLPTIPNTSEEGIVALDTCVNNKLQQKSEENHSRVNDCPNTPVSHAESAASVSTIIDALQLSNIDWDALSFTSSPPPQMAANHTTEPKRSKTTEVEVRENDNIKRDTSSDLKGADFRCATGVCNTDYPLRDRVIIRNTAKAIDRNAIDNNVVSKQLNYKLPSIIQTSCPGANSKPNSQIPSNGGIRNELPGRESTFNTKEPLTEKRLYASNKEESEVQMERRATVQAPSKVKDQYNGSKKLPQKYRFVKKPTSSSDATPRKHCSDVGQREKNVPQTKKSVCMSMVSSSEESDMENQQLGPRKKARIKSLNMIKGSFHSDVILDPVSGPKTTKPTSKVAPTLKPSNPQSRRNMSVPVESVCEDRAPATVSVDVLLLASPVTVSDSDDSVVCSESPLPLAERLRRKFLK